jgi:hypothetical protein
MALINNSKNPPIHVMCYGESGTKKSTFAASFPKPLLVFFFDPLGKDSPYLRQGIPSGLMPSQFPGFMTQDVFNEAGELQITLEYFLDPFPQKPSAFPCFQNRFAQLLSHIWGVREIPGEPDWKSIAFDSATYLELSARKYAQYFLNPNAKDPRQWFGSSTDQLEEILMISTGSIPRNVITICHVDEDKDEAGGVMVKNPALPGRLRKHGSSGYSEFYRVFVQRGDGKPGVSETRYALQTEPNGLYNAGSQIMAPNGCEPTYEALWKRESFGVLPYNSRTTTQPS